MSKSCVIEIEEAVILYTHPSQKQPKPINWMPNQEDLNLEAIESIPNIDDFTMSHDKVRCLLNFAYDHVNLIDA